MYFWDSRIFHRNEFHCINRDERDTPINTEIFDGICSSCHLPLQIHPPSCSIMLWTWRAELWTTASTLVLWLCQLWPMRIIERGAGGQGTDWLASLFSMDGHVPWPEISTPTRQLFLHRHLSGGLVTFPRLSSSGIGTSPCPPHLCALIFSLYSVF